MPELPEVESIRRGLRRRILGRRVAGVVVAREDVVHHRPAGADLCAALLEGCTITAIHRLGKQLALLGRIGTVQGVERVVCIQLGMSGSLVVGDAEMNNDHHCHVSWRLDPVSEEHVGCRDIRLVFRDPRRFGGLRRFSSMTELRREHWERLGPDALKIRVEDLHARLQGTTRAIKAALLDQGVLAGLGNIYVDELLFVCGIHPLMPANRLGLEAVRGLTRAMRALLRRSIAAGGSTLRDYRGAGGQPGGYQRRHQVYGRVGERCSQCGGLLMGLMVAGRSTTCCPRCQRRRRGRVLALPALTP